MKVYRFTLVILLILLSKALHAQPDYYRLLPRYKVNFNPAYAGYNKQYNISALANKQWLGFEGSPFNMAAVFDAYFKPFKSGFSVIHKYESIALNRNHRHSFQYSYLFSIGDGSSICLGAGSEMNITILKAESFIYPEGSDINLSEADLNYSAFRQQIGALYQYKYLEFGAAFSYRWISSNTTKMSISQPYNYFLNFRGNFSIAKFDIRPEILLINLMIREQQIVPFLELTYNDVVFSGVGYENNSLSNYIGVHLWKTFSIIYGLQWKQQNSLLNDANVNSHYTMLTVSF